MDKTLKLALALFLTMLGIAGLITGIGLTVFFIMENPWVSPFTLLMVFISCYIIAFVMERLT